jgi:hypothetical protein
MYLMKEKWCSLCSRDCFFGNSFSVSLKKKGLVSKPLLFFSANPGLYAEVSNRSHTRQSFNKIRWFVEKMQKN